MRIEIKSQNLIKKCLNNVLSEKIDLEINGISIDSRKIKKNDIIVYISPTGEVPYKVGKVRSIDDSSMNVDRVMGFTTSSNVSPQKLDYVPAENFIGKITDVGVYPVGKILHENFNPKMLLMIIVAFAAPIIILKVRKRLQN